MSNNVTLDRFLKDSLLFFILILGFHFLFRFWAYHLNYWPLDAEITQVSGLLANIVFRNSSWILKHLTNYSFSLRGNSIFVGNGFVGVNEGCSGLKQFLQWIVLMVFFPGPWKHKLWFIPSGLVVLHLVNIFRISALSALLLYLPEHWKFMHDWIFRPFFYVVMFVMWVLWVEKFKSSRKDERGIKIK